MPIPRGSVALLVALCGCATSSATAGLANAPKLRNLAVARAAAVRRRGRRTRLVRARSRSVREPARVVAIATVRIDGGAGARAARVADAADAGDVDSAIALVDSGVRERGVAVATGEPGGCCPGGDLVCAR